MGKNTDNNCSLAKTAFELDIINYINTTLYNTTGLMTTFISDNKNVLQTVL